MTQVGHFTPGIGCYLIGKIPRPGSKTIIDARIKPKSTTKPKPKDKTCHIFKLDDITSSDNPVMSTS